MEKEVWVVWFGNANRIAKKRGSDGLLAIFDTEADAERNAEFGAPSMEVRKARLIIE